MLKFLGRGAAFADQHTSAFFTSGKDFVLLDCPATAFQKLKHFDFSEYENIYVLVTHTHGDHAGGIGMFLQYLHFVCGRVLTVVAPSQEVLEDLIILLMHIEGCADDWFDIMTADSLSDKEWMNQSVLTKHARTMKGRCFGYALNIDGTSVVYTGDTRTLEPFMRYLEDGSILYTEISFYKSDVHMYFEDALPMLRTITDLGVKVYLMHIDDEEKLKEQIQGSELQLVSLYEDEEVIE